MRILLIGQAAFGAKVFEALQAQKENVVGVFTPAEQPGQRPDALKTAAVDAGIDVVQPLSYKTEQTFEQYKAFNLHTNRSASCVPPFSPRSTNRN